MKRSFIVVDMLPKGAEQVDMRFNLQDVGESIGLTSLWRSCFRNEDVLTEVELPVGFASKHRIQQVIQVESEKGVTVSQLTSLLGEFTMTNQQKSLVGLSPCFQKQYPECFAQAKPKP